MLEKAEIFDVVILSIFNYEYEVYFLKGILKYWNLITNICYLSDEEIFFSLWDMNSICGFPILGVRYDEHVSDTKMLFSEVIYVKF